MKTVLVLLVVLLVAGGLYTLVAGGVGGLVGAIIKDPVADRVAWTEYLELVVRERDGWGEFYEACREVS